MAISDTVKEAFTGPGRKWLVIGVLGGGVYLWWTRMRGSKAPAAGADTVTLDQTGAATDTGGPVVGTGTGPGGSTQDTNANPGASPPEDNGTWIQQAVARLQLPPYNGDPVGIFNALTKALDGEPVTPAEANLVGWAIQVEGTPPGGAPAIAIIPTPKPTTTPPPTAPAPTPKPTTPGPANHTVKSGETLSGIGAGWGKSAQQVYTKNAGAIEAAAKAHGRSSSKGGPNNSPGWWIYPGTVLLKP